MGADVKHVLVTFASLLGTLICAQLVGSIGLGEPVRWRVLTVLTIFAVALVWAIQPPDQAFDASPQSSTASSTSSQGDNS